MGKGFVWALSGALMLASTSASALILDLTQTLPGAVPGSANPIVIVVENGDRDVTFEVSSTSVGSAVFNNPFPAGGPLPSFCGLLACDQGGVGVRDAVVSDTEILRVRLDQTMINAGYSINIQEYFFLHLVLATPQPGPTTEAVLVDHDGQSPDQVIGALDPSPIGARSALATSAAATDTNGALFRAGDLGSNSTSSDFALAGIRFELLLNGDPPPSEDVPLPASLPLLLAGLAGLGLARRRSRRAE